MYDEERDGALANVAEKENEKEEEDTHPIENAEATHINSPRAGNIQVIDYARLLKIAEQHALVIKLERRMGDFVARDALLISLLPGQKISQELLDDLYSAIDIGTERTLFSDVLFGIRQLVDIALRALSPAINDPTTAVNSIDYLTNILINAARHADVRGRYYDEEGRLRLIAPRPTFVMMLDLAFDQIRHSSGSEVTVTLRILDALIEIAQATSDATRHAAVWRHAVMISRNVDGIIKEPLERAQINDRLRQVAARCGARLEGIELQGAEVERPELQLNA
jgi:uncharacterized membrane protein